LSNQLTIPFGKKKRGRDRWGSKKEELGLKKVSICSRFKRKERRKNQQKNLSQSRTKGGKTETSGPRKPERMEGRGGTTQIEVGG